MDTPGAEPTLTVAVLGDGEAPVQQLVRHLAGRVRAAWGHSAASFVHPWLESPASWRPYLPCWAMLRVPARLLAMPALTAHPANIRETAWHLGQADAALLVVNAEAPPAFLRELLLLAAHSGQGRAVVFLDTSRAVDDRADPAEREIRLAMMLAGLPGDDVTVIRGAVRDEAALDATLRAIESDLPTPAWDATSPLRLIIRSAGADGSRGRITSGRITRGQAVRVFNGGWIRNLRVKEIRRFGQTLDEAVAGQNVAVRLSASDGRPVGAGAVLVPVGTGKVASSFEGRVTLFRAEDGGRRKFVMSGFKPAVWLPATQRKAAIEVLGRPHGRPGETFPARVTFGGGRAEVVESGEAFVLRHDKRIIGHGVVD